MGNLKGKGSSKGFLVAIGKSQVSCTKSILFVLYKPGFVVLTQLKNFEPHLLSVLIVKKEVKLFKNPTIS